MAEFLSADDAILHASCYQANVGLFSALLGECDLAISDELNHGTIIDGIRLGKARRRIVPHAEPAAVERELRKARAAGAGRILVVTDGVFSMDGDVADLAALRRLCDEYEAMLMVDDSHATGFWGPTGRGTIEQHGLLGRVEIVTSTFGKALGGGLGGFVAGRGDVIAMLRQRSRSYLLSNSLPPALVGAALAAIELAAGADAARERLRRNTVALRAGLSTAGFRVGGVGHPIVPILIGDALLAARMADELFEHGVFVVAFFHPVVPVGQARIRVQLSAAHEPADLERALAAFVAVGRQLGVIGWAAGVLNLAGASCIVVAP